MEQQLFWCAAGVMLCHGIRRHHWPPRRVGRALALFLLGLMALQAAMVVAAGMSLLQTLLPLHLCSATSFIAVPMLWRWDRRLFHFCWYLGMPGALIALCIPVVGYSPWPKLMQAVFMVTHAALVFAPLVMRSAGIRPRRLSVWPVYLMGNALMLLALVANHWTGSNYMFLQDAPIGTPLALMAANGMPGYLAWLELIVLLLLRLSSRRADAGKLLTHPQPGRLHRRLTRA